MSDAVPARPVPVRLACIAAGLVAAIVVYFLLAGAAAGGLSQGGRLAASVGALMAVWWMTEAIPLEVTGLVPLAVFPVLGIATAREAAGPYAEDIIFLFLGGMLLGAAMERWGVHQRLALSVMAVMGTSPSRLVGAFLVTTAFLSMWVSNTAATVMMLPIGASVAAIVGQGLTTSDLSPSDRRRAGNFGPCLVLAIAFGATIGGVGTVIGTPPIAQYAGHMRRALGIEVTFAHWLRLGLPVLAVVIPTAWIALAKVALPVPTARVPGVAAGLAEQRGALGPWRHGEVLTVAIFVLAAVLWVGVPLLRAVGDTQDGAFVPAWPWLMRISDGTIAIAAAILLFVIPADGARGQFVLDWRAGQRVPWGILLLFGGGLSLAAALTANGVDKYIASLAGPLAGVPVIVVLLVFSIVAIMLTEFASNTALVAAALPVAGAIAQTLGLPPAVLLVTVTLAASLGFMLPGGTAPNALAFASGRVTMRQMMRGGLCLDLACGLGAPLIVYAAWKLGVLPGL
jgi:solute carrier family 13 (sodium-dependent dicarboxylate transporter), member 2/3/5